MKTALYPGSFNPFHRGHQDVLQKALKVFDKVIVAQGINPDKPPPTILSKSSIDIGGNFRVISYEGLTSDLANSLKVDAVIKGLRGGGDFDIEQVQQYWNEDLGLKVPTFYIIADRQLIHISSSAIRTTQKFVQTQLSAAGEY